MSPLSRFDPGAPLANVPNATNVVIFTPYERKGVALMATAGVSSFTFVSTLLLYIIFSALSPWPKSRPDSPTPFTRKQIAAFVISLLVSDLIHSIAGVVQVKWAVEHRITQGHVCTLQATALAMGDLSSSFWSCIIALHTFSGLALGKQWPRRVVIATVVTGWTFTIVMTIIGPTTLATADNGPFYSIAGIWCFISSNYAVARLGIIYVPRFLAAAIILVSYVLVFLVLRGTISFSQHHGQSSELSDHMTDVLSPERIIIAKRVLWYPFAYVTCFIPAGTLRLLALRQVTVSEPIWIFAMVFLFFLGTIDSVIYATTRKLIQPLNFQTHLRTYSDNSSARTAVSSPKPMVNERFDDHRGEATEKSGYVYPSRYKSSFGGISHGQAEAYPEGAIHVTLERIQEVM